MIEKYLAGVQRVDLEITLSMEHTLIVPESRRISALMAIYRVVWARKFRWETDSPLSPLFFLGSEIVCALYYNYHMDSCLD
jgi:hypothetical protein